MNQRIPTTHEISRKQTRIYPGAPDWVRKQEPEDKHLEGWARAIAARKDNE